MQNLHEMVAINPAVLGGRAFITVEQIVFDAQMGKQLVLLENHSNAPLARRLVDPPVATEKTVAIQHDLSAVRFHQSGQHANQGRFAAAGGTEDADSVAGNFDIRRKGKRSVSFSHGKRQVHCCLRIPFLALGRQT